MIPVCELVVSRRFSYLRESSPLDISRADILSVRIFFLMEIFQYETFSALNVQERKRRSLRHEQ